MCRLRVAADHVAKEGGKNHIGIDPITRSVTLRHVSPSVQHGTHLEHGTLTLEVERDSSSPRRA